MKKCSKHRHHCVKGSSDRGQEVIDITKCFDEVFKTRNWRIVQVKGEENEPAPEGPSMYHVPCKYMTHILHREAPLCVGCCVVIPSKIQVVYSLMNFKRGDDSGYFR
jgi:hypothetical protein